MLELLRRSLIQVNIKSSEEWSNEILSTPGLLQGEPNAVQPSLDSL